MVGRCHETSRTQTRAAGLGRDWQQPLCSALSPQDRNNATNDFMFNDQSSLLQYPSPSISLLLKSDYLFPLLETRQLRRLWKSLLTRFISPSEDFILGGVEGGLKSSTPLGHVCACVCVSVYWHVCKTVRT